MTKRPLIAGIVLACIAPATASAGEWWTIRATKGRTVLIEASGLGFDRPGAAPTRQTRVVRFWSAHVLDGNQHYQGQPYRYEIALSAIACEHGKVAELLRIGYADDGRPIWRSEGSGGFGRIEPGSMSELQMQFVCNGRGAWQALGFQQAKGSPLKIAENSSAGPSRQTMQQP